MSTAVTEPEPPRRGLDVEPPEPARPASAPASTRSRVLARYAGLPFVLALAVVLDTRHLEQNGYANVFYSAGVQSMLHSLHNFLFASFDPGGLITIDKPPVALWVQVLSAKIFGFSPLSLLLPEALAGVLSVALLYVVLARRLGLAAALAGSLTLALFPSFVAVSRDNGVDPVLLALMTAAGASALRACENGRLRTLLASAVLVGLAFNTKTLAAYLIVPGIALAYLLCAPVPPRRRLLQLLAAGAVMLVVSFAWIVFVDSVPASKRPYVGSSKDNSELGLTFGYNGLGRVEGQEGGPHGVNVKQGGFVPPHQEQRSDAIARAHHTGPIPPVPGEHPPKPEPARAPVLVKGREKEPIPFGPAPKPLRLFGKGLGDQAAWMLPFALFGLLALALLALAGSSLERRCAGRARRRGSASRDARERRNGHLDPWEPPPAGDAAARRPPAPPADARAPRESTRAARRARPRGRRRALERHWATIDRRLLALTLTFGGWLLAETVVLTVSKGIVHPYYVSGLAPATGAMAGAGAFALVELARGRLRLPGLALGACALLATLAAQLVLMHREHYLLWFVPVLVAGVALALLALLALRRLAAPAVALALAVLLVTPGAYAATTWLAPVEGTFPVAGPHAFPGPGGYGVDARDMALNRALVDFASTHRPGSRWALLTVASDSAAPMMLMGLPAGSLGGYSGTDPALDGPRLARLVARGQARYVLLGGGYSMRGGNAATKAVLRACRELAPWEWRSPVDYPFGLVLFDCAGRAKALAAS